VSLVWNAAGNSCTIGARWRSKAGRNFRPIHENEKSMVQCADVGGDSSKRFLHVTLAAGNDTPGRTAEVRFRAAEVLGNVIDEFTSGLPGLASVTVHVQDIDRSRGYSTTAERRKTHPF
jgi:hypothetical protein